MTAQEQRVSHAKPPRLTEASQDADDCYDDGAESVVAEGLHSHVRAVPFVVHPPPSVPRFLESGATDVSSPNGPATRRGLSHVISAGGLFDDDT